jgi:multisubunit Na+/H+ antiporter MnhF subunit
MTAANVQSTINEAEHENGTCDTTTIAETTSNIRNNTTNNDSTALPPDESTTPSGVAAVWKLKLFVGVLNLDAVVSIVVLAPIWPFLRHIEDAALWRHYTLYRSLVDLAFLAALRISASALAILICYCRAKLPTENSRYDHIDLYHPNGDRKTREQLEQEALEESFWPWFLRLILRPSLSTEILAVTAQALAIVKCLARMNVEIGTYQDSHPYHPVFWLAILCTAILSAIEASYLEDICKIAGQCGHEHFSGSPPPMGILRSFSSQLLAPLLENEHTNGDVEQEVDGITTTGANGDTDPIVENEENVRATSDITADPAYKASWTDLLMMCSQDSCMILAAFVFLLLAAVAQVLIPKYLGNILDALAAAFGNPDDDSSRHMSMWDVPHFMSNIKLLVIASILAGVFAGLRGSIFVR